MDTSPYTRINERRQRYVPISLDHRVIDAFPDNGAEVDFISSQFAKNSRFSINSAETQKITLPNGREITTEGTTSLSFRIKGEKEVFKRKFHVLKDLVHDIVLGRAFLETTSTLTTFFHRIKERALPWKSWIPQLHLLGSIAPRISGTVNGMTVYATDDIGSDIVAISWKEAMRLGLQIHTDPTYRTLIGFADGSRVRTDGTVVDVDWRFGGDSNAKPIKVNLHVLRNLTCDLILSNDLLIDNHAYSHHIDCFLDEDGPVATTNDAAWFGMITDLSNEKSMLEYLFAWFRSQTQNTDPENVDAMTKARHELNCEVGRQLYHQERIADLPVAEKIAAQHEELERKRKWVEDHAPSGLLTAPSQSGNSSTIPTSPFSGVQATAPKKKRFTFGLKKLGHSSKSTDRA
jgi:hypothetical protein